MKHKLNEIWSEQESKTKKVWKLQAPKGILTFSSKKKALEFVKSLNYSS